MRFLEKPPRRTLRREPYRPTLHVRGLSAGQRRGVLIAGNLRVPCILGRTGRTWRKREGDGATPCGSWPMRRR